MADRQAVRWDIRRLTAHHAREDFDCGDSAECKDLNTYLIKYARQNAAKDLVRIYVATRGGEKRVRGYYALTSGSVAFNNLPDNERKKLPKYPIPVALVARLAVDRSEHGGGLGADLLMHALLTACTAADQLGIWAVEVHAKDDRARAFYTKLGFTQLADSPLHRYLSMRLVRRLFEVGVENAKR